MYYVVVLINESCGCIDAFMKKCCGIKGEVVGIVDVNCCMLLVSLRKGILYLD